MALIVKENLPLSTHRRPYLRFSEEARGPSGQSQLTPVNPALLFRRIFSFGLLRRDDHSNDLLVHFLNQVSRLLDCDSAQDFKAEGCLADKFDNERGYPGRSSTVQSSISGSAYREWMTAASLCSVGVGSSIRIRD